MFMTNTEYQNWLWHMLYYLERKNAPKGKITGMVTLDEFITFIHEEEIYAWEMATSLEKRDGEIDPPRNRTQIHNHLRGLEGRKLIRKYKNKDGEICLKTT